jgi:hypothetical protein
MMKQITEFLIMSIQSILHAIKPGFKDLPVEFRQHIKHFLPGHLGHETLRAIDPFSPIDARSFDKCKDLPPGLRDKTISTQ